MYPNYSTFRLSCLIKIISSDSSLRIYVQMWQLPQMERHNWILWRSVTIKLPAIYLHVLRRTEVSTTVNMTCNERWHLTFLIDLQVLDLSYNSLSGQAMSIEPIRYSLLTLVLSHNNFSGAKSEISIEFYLTYSGGAEFLKIPTEFNTSPLVHVSENHVKLTHVMLKRYPYFRLTRDSLICHIIVFLLRFLKTNTSRMVFSLI